MKELAAEAVDASFQKMANELSVVELEAMIMDSGQKAKKKTKPRRKKKAWREVNRMDLDMIIYDHLRL